MPDRPVTSDEWWAGAVSEAEKQQLLEIGAIIESIQQRQAAAAARRIESPPPYPKLTLLQGGRDG